MNVESLIGELQPVYDGSEMVLSRLAGVSLAALAVALGFHVLKLLARARAWENIVRAAYPTEPLRFRDALGAFLAGVGVDAFVPARAGEFLRLGLVKARLPNSTMPALASTLLAESAFDMLLSVLVVGLTVAFGVGLPLPSPAAALEPLAHHPLLASSAATALLIGAGSLALFLRHRIRRVVREIGRGLSIFGSPAAYFRRVVSWQTLSWGLRLGSVYWFLVAFHLSASLPMALLVVVVQLVSSALPLTPGGAGTQQAMLVGALSASAAASVLGFGVGMQAATALADLVLGAGALIFMTGSLHLHPVVAAKEPLARVPQPAS